MRMPRKRAQSVWSFLLYAALGTIGFSRELCTLGLTALNTPPTRCGRNVMVTPISLRNSSRLWNAKYVHGLEQSKKHSTSAMIWVLVGGGRQRWPLRRAPGHDAADVCHPTGTGRAR